ncbi:MAG: hypothetical protein L6W00_03165 [Lentisphaeria bacterium]|nr:MAG: hypothetical protein L6W00_03165 [Lentisphaeria bacterium]
MGNNKGRGTHAGAVDSETRRRITYQLEVRIYDATVAFCARYIDRRGSSRSMVWGRPTFSRI